jgi:hypothetical protein
MADHDDGTGPRGGGAGGAGLDDLEAYRQAVSLYRFYLALVIATNIAVFAVTGAILAYVTSLDLESNPTALLGLVVPFLLNSGTAAVYARGLPEARALAKEIRTREHALGLTFHIQGAVLLRLLWVSLAGYSVVTGIVAVTGLRPFV